MAYEAMEAMKSALLGHSILEITLYSDYIELSLSNGQSARLMFKSASPVELDVVWMPNLNQS